MGIAPSPTPTRAEGHLRLRAERVGERTRLTELQCHAPLQVLRSLYLDPLQPGMLYATVVSASGGVLQGDRLELEATVGAGAQLHLDTPSATRLYRMPDAAASQRVTLTVAGGGYLEYLPEPTIPYAGSEFGGQIDCVIDEDATLILAEVVTAGRALRGEVHRFTRHESTVGISRPGGEPLAVDTTRLVPADGLAFPGRLGAFAAVGSLHVIHAGFDPGLLRPAESPGLHAGASSLPGGIGAWLKVLGPDGPSVGAVLGGAARAARQAILGTPPPASRRV